MQLGLARFAVKHPKLLYKYLSRERNLSTFLQIDPKQVKAYLAEANVISQQLLERMKENAASGSMVSPLRGPVIYTCIRALKPKIMVETGVASGSSTTYILNAMKANGVGKLYSIDLPNADPAAQIPQGKEPGWLVPDVLRANWRLTIGESKKELPALVKEAGVIDVFLHDSEHTYENMMFEYNTVWPHIPHNGALLSDDAMWNKSFTHFVAQQKPERIKVFDGIGGAIK